MNYPSDVQLMLDLEACGDDGGSPLRMLERASIAVLVAASLLMVFTGVANIGQW